jgi:hypothetical protein
MRFPRLRCCLVAAHNLAHILALHNEKNAAQQKYYKDLRETHPGSLHVPECFYKLLIL